MSRSEQVSSFVSVVELFLCEGVRCQEGVHKHLLAGARCDGSYRTLLGRTTLRDRKLRGREIEWREKKGGKGREKDRQRERGREGERDKRIFKRKSSLYFCNICSP